MSIHRALGPALIVVFGWCSTGLAFPLAEGRHQCVGTAGSYADLGYFVRAIRVTPFVGVLPGETEFRDALANAEDKLKPLDTGQLLNSPLSLRKMSNLQEALRDELEKR